MAKMQVMTLENITLYDELIKNYVDTADAKSIKTATLEGKVLKLYRVSEPVGDTAPAYEITLPETDVSGLLAKLTGATENNVVTVGADGTVKDSGTALTNLALKTEVEAVDEKIGTLADLSTTAKTDLVVAINEVRAAVEVGGTGSQVTIDTSTTTEGYLKTYTIKQGTTEVGKIDIPKDLVVTGGEIVTNPDGQPAGTYVKLTIANQTAPVYINVADLVDAYTAQASATQIQLAISDTNEISATIVAGSVGTTELADNSITTAKIADANVTLAKLGADVTPTLTQVATNKTNIEALQLLVGEGYEPISTEAINGLFS
jgi:hypothetical protein